MKRYGLIGRRLEHSFSARYFADKLLGAGISDCTYALYELSGIEELPRLLAATPELRGFNVTIPYKEAVIPYLDELSPRAQRIGAVNCVCRDAGGRLTGYNTDVDGLRIAMAELIDPRDPPERALVLGTGGAARAVDFVLHEMGIPCATVSRDPARGAYAYDTLTDDTLAAHRLVINATPVGMYPSAEQAPRIPYAALTSRHYLLDLVYNPPETRFLALGRARGARVQNGARMLAGQAEASWRIWSEQ